MQLSWRRPCSYPLEFLKSNTSPASGSSSLVFARRGISCRYESAIRKINKTKPISGINIHNAVMYFEGRFVTGLSVARNGSTPNARSQRVFPGLPVSVLGLLVGLGRQLPQLHLWLGLFRCGWGIKRKSLLAQVLSGWPQRVLAGLPEIRC